jgi:oligoribonuclease NrnB/cAMP/cGMP phosphodiesterase (DHH superfamily)
MPKNPLCIYHANCADGFGAAWAIWKFFGHGNVDFHPGVYQDPPPDVADCDVILVDFSYKRQVLLEMAQTARSILILDHHKSAAEELRDFEPPENPVLSGYNPERIAQHAWECDQLPVRALFDMSRSGAMLAWNYFFPNQAAPRLLRHIEDRDLWRFELENTREIQAALFSYPYDFEVWDMLVSDVQIDGGDALAMEGEAIERKHFKDIHELIRAAAYRTVIAGHDVPVLNAPYFYSSDAGHIMAQGEPFAACYYDTADHRIYSLRSSDKGLDVSVIAGLFGGGGHRNAAGFKVPHGADISLEAERDRPEHGIEERPILFSGAMVQAILEGRKTQTRRIVKHYGTNLIRRVSGPSRDGTFDFIFPDELDPAKDGIGHLVKCPYGQPGDRLWVRETWKPHPDPVNNALIIYKTTDGGCWPDLPWRPSIHMPRWASRILLEITGVRVERLQEISEKDAIAEGIERINAGDHWAWRDYSGNRQALSPVFSYQSLWESINGPGSWAVNPWVWVLEFRRIET